MSTEDTSGDSSDGEEFTCPWDGCERSFDTDRGVKTHHKKKHGDSIAASKGPGGDYACPWDGCDYSSTKTGVRMHHAQTHGERVWVEKVTVVCVQCGGTFEVYPYREGEARFCSRGCRGEWRSENKSGGNSPLWDGADVVLECETCGEEFGVRPWRVGRARFCSQACEYEWLAKAKIGENSPGYNGGTDTYHCEQCGDAFQAHTHETARFCSLPCMYQWRSENERGENSPFWKGGFARRQDAHWLEQREKALERDGYACRRCGVTEAEYREKMGQSMDVHHIVPYRQFDDPKEANKLSNLMVLCRSCHAKMEGLPVDNRAVGGAD